MLESQIINKWYLRSNLSMLYDLVKFGATRIFHLIFQFISLKLLIIISWDLSYFLIVLQLLSVYTVDLLAFLNSWKVPRTTEKRGRIFQKREIKLSWIVLIFTEFIKLLMCVPKQSIWDINMAEAWRHVEMWLAALLPVLNWNGSEVKRKILKVFLLATVPLL